MRNNLELRKNLFSFLKELDDHNINYTFKEEQRVFRNDMALHIKLDNGDILNAYTWVDEFEEWDNPILMTIDYQPRYEGYAVIYDWDSEREEVIELLKEFKNG